MFLISDILLYLFERTLEGQKSLAKLLDPLADAQDSIHAILHRLLALIVRAITLGVLIEFDL